MLLRVADIVSCTQGRLLTSAPTQGILCSGLSWDSRTVSAGDLYLALPGERVDGHDFVSAAFEAGAAAALVRQKPSGSTLAAAANRGGACILVDDTMVALSELASFWRREVTAKVIALTGSSGKTTTKAMIEHVLSAHGSVVATAGNQNNELGVPATLLRIGQDSRYAVVEMGMRGPGQIEDLCRIAAPDMALVTNVGTSHLELLGSRENIAKAKAEIFGSLGRGGTAFINSSDDYARQLRDFGATGRDGVEEVFFDGSGKDPDAYDRDLRPEVFASGIELDEAGCAAFDLHVPGASRRLRMRVAGLHNVHNATAAAAVAWKLGMAVDEIATALAGFQAVSGRQRSFENSRGVLIVDDAYNANPDSMGASLSAFAAMRVPGRRIAVLGDMGELGSFSREGHESMGRAAADAGLDRLYCIGDLSRSIARCACEAGMPEDAVEHSMDALSVLEELKAQTRSGDAVLVKASHAMALDRIVEGLAD